jgi:hypothetical protein
LTIIADLLKVPERENDGSNTLDRFDFQTAWGLTKVLRLHESDARYAVAFEFHDDIAELDDADAPERATFYQVKTSKKGTWSFAKIASRDKAADKVSRKPSHAGKMFDNVSRFGEAVRSLVFVSNQPLVDMPEGHRELAFELAADKKKLGAFVAALKSECPAFSETLHLKLFHFLDCGMHLESYEKTLVGDIALFVDKQVGAGVNARSFSLTLIDECRTRSKKLAEISDFEELKKSKFVTRKDMDEWLGVLRKSLEQRPDWAAVARHLGLSFAEEARLEREWRTYGLERHGTTTASSIEFADKVKKVVEPLMDAADTMWDGVTAAFPEIRRLVDVWRPGASNDYVRAVILYEYKR